MFITVIYVVAGYLLGGIIQSSTINLFAQKNTLSDATFTMRMNVAVLDWVTQTIVPCFTKLHHDSFFHENIGRPSTSASETKDLRQPDRQIGIRVLVKIFILFVDELWQSYVSQNRDERYIL